MYYNNLYVTLLYSVFKARGGNISSFVCRLQSASLWHQFSLLSVIMVKYLTSTRQGRVWG